MYEIIKRKLIIFDDELSLSCCEYKNSALPAEQTGNAQKDYTTPQVQSPILLAAVFSRYFPCHPHIVRLFVSVRLFGIYCTSQIQIMYYIKFLNALPYSSEKP